MEHRETDCETSQNGKMSSQKSPKIQKCLHPHTFLTTQNRNGPGKVASRKHRIFLSAQEIEIAKDTCEH